jgi:hypothetical protein
MKTHLFTRQNNSGFIEIRFQQCEVDGLVTNIYKGNTLHYLNKMFWEQLHTKFTFFTYKIFDMAWTTYKTPLPHSSVVMCVFVVTGVLIEVLHSNGHLFWLQYACFQTLGADTQTARLSHKLLFF